MTDRPLMRFHLEPGLRKSAEAGEHNFIGRIVEVLEENGFSIDFQDHPTGRAKRDTAFTMSHMKPPVGARGLTFRRVYHYPFWQIDPTDERWNWQVAKATFDPETVDRQEAQRFYGFWQKRLFGDAVSRRYHVGIVYVPLQGRLTEHRSFQSCSPLEMLEACLAHEPDRRIVATLHPKESYSPAELAALEALATRHPRLEVRTGDMIPLLQDCDYVVTQNSSAAFAGYFFGKPVLLFAGIDFHHIAVRARPEALAECFARVAAHQPDYARYLWWFWQDQSINAGRPDAKTKIAHKLRRFGWPIR